MNIPSLDRWSRLWRRVTSTRRPEAVYQELRSRYSEPHRHYHNLDHLAECLREFDSARHLANDAVAVELATWFHDVIYDAHATDNEEKSAELARKHIAAADGAADLREAVAALVLATKTHEFNSHPDAPLLVDVDLSILGREPDRFREYESQIRQEYSWVPESIFAVKRAEILQRFLRRERIYSTPLFFDRYEQQARANLESSIRVLNQAGPA